MLGPLTIRLAIEAHGRDAGSHRGWSSPGRTAHHTHVSCGGGGHGVELDYGEGRLCPGSLAEVALARSNPRS